MLWIGEVDVGGGGYGGSLLLSSRRRKEREGRRRRPSPLPPGGLLDAEGGSRARRTLQALLHQII